MTDLLTTRQVQERLQVDRITIYRMLQDGRLKGIKIGQQWRFPQSEIDRLISGAPAAEPEPPAEAGVKPFPTHCVQTVQNLLVEIGQLGALVVDLAGEPLTEPSPACAFCRLMLANPQTQPACRASWRQAAQGDAETFTCHAGLQYLRAPVMDEDEPIGYILVGQAHLQPADAEAATDRLQKIFAGDPPQAREWLEAAAQIPQIPAEQMHTILAWPARASAAIEAILRERSGLINRLQRIAQMSRMELE